MSNNKNIKVENLTENDLEETKAFMLGIIKDDFGYDFNPQWHSDIVNIYDIYVGNPKSCLFITKDQEGIIGTIAGRAYDKSYNFTSKYNSDNTLGIWRHYVKKDLRGRGVGTKLLKQLEEFAKENGYKYIYLHTQKTIPGSLEYCVSKGYEIIFDAQDDLQTIHLEKQLFNL